jgi:hypothetical protein
MIEAPGWLIAFNKYHSTSSNLSYEEGRLLIQSLDFVIVVFGKRAKPVCLEGRLVSLSKQRDIRDESYMVQTKIPISPIMPHTIGDRVPLFPGYYAYNRGGGT